MQQQHDPNTITNFGTWLTWAAVAAIAASLSSLRTTITMRQAAFHVALASFIGSCTPYAIFAVWPSLPWYMGIPVSMVIGLLIFGIAIMLERTNTRVGDYDPTILLPKNMRPATPPRTGKVEIDQDDA